LKDRKNLLEDKLMRSKAVVSLIVFVAVATLSITEAAAPPGPKLVIASMEHSFGEVKPGTPLKYTFKLKNEGQDNLEIKNVSPACGCTTSNYDRVVAPNQTGGITLAIENTEKYKGEVVKTATVTTNDPDHPSFTLTLRASFPSE
jgi:hypothetical protein